MFQQNQLDDVRTNIAVWLTSLAIQVNKFMKLNHVLDEEYQITHILASVPREKKWCYGASQDRQKNRPSTDNHG